MARILVNRVKKCGRKTGYLLALVLLMGCINDDLDVCGVKSGVEYDVQLETNLTTEVSTELTTQAEVELGSTISKGLEHVFRKYASDVNLGFYSSDSTLAHHEVNIINDTAASYSIHLPVKNYTHLAIANEQVDPHVSVKGQERAQDLMLYGSLEDTVKSHTTGIFTARQQISIEDKDQNFDVVMYMANCAEVLVMDRDDQNVASIKGYARGLGTGFHVRDSVFVFEKDQVVELEYVDMEEDNLYGLYGVGFPSRDKPIKREGRNTTPHDPNDSTDVDFYWAYEIYVTMKDGRTTKTALKVRKPLRAGDISIDKVKINKDGGLTPKNKMELGASVSTDWKPGGEFEGGFN